MTGQHGAPVVLPVTMFLKPSFMVTAQAGAGLQVAVTLQLPPARPDPRN